MTAPREEPRPRPKSIHIFAPKPLLRPLTRPRPPIIQTLQSAGMVKRYHASFPSLSYGFDSRYPLQNIT